MTVSTASFTALGTGAAVTVLDERALPAAHEIVLDELRCIDEACSRFRDDSELTLLNRSAGVPFAASPLLLEALVVAVYAAARTDGDVDPTVGRALRALGWDRDFTVVVARRGEPPRLRIVPAAGWQRSGSTAGSGTVRMPAGVELDLGATAKALAADRCAQRVARGDGRGRARHPRRRHRRRGRRAGRRLADPRRRRPPQRRRRADGQTVAIADGRARDLEHDRAPLARRRDASASHRRSAQRRARGRGLAHGQRRRAHLRRGQHGEHRGDRARRSARSTGSSAPASRRGSFAPTARPSRRAGGPREAAA